MAIQAQTKTNETIAKIIRMAAEADSFLEPDLEWRRLVKEIEPLKAARRFEWDGVMGVLYTYVMKFEEAEACFQNSLKLKEDPVTIFNYFHSLLYGGQFRKAQNLYARYGHPSLGFFSKLMPLAHECCAFETYLSFGTDAKKMDIDVPLKLPKATVDLLTGAGMNQDAVALHMEIAAEVLHRHKLRPRTKRILAGDEDGASMFSVLFAVPRTADEVFDLNIELAQAEEAHGVSKQIAFDVAFIPQLESDDVPVDEVSHL